MIGSSARRDALRRIISSPPASARARVHACLFARIARDCKCTLEARRRPSSPPPPTDFLPAPSSADFVRERRGDCGSSPSSARMDIRDAIAPRPGSLRILDPCSLDRGFSRLRETRLEPRPHPPPLPPLRPLCHSFPSRLAQERGWSRAEAASLASNCRSCASINVTRGKCAPRVIL